MGDVNLDRRVADDELGGDLAVGVPVGDEREDFALAWRQLLQARASAGRVGRRRMKAVRAAAE